MDNLIFSGAVFIIVYAIYLLFVVLRDRAIKKFDKSKEMRYLSSRYKLDLKKCNMKKMANIIGLSNAFIISVTILCIGIVDNIMLKLLIGFVVLIPSILFIYHLIGKSLETKYRKKD